MDNPSRYSDKNNFHRKNIHTKMRIYYPHIVSLVLLLSYFIVKNKYYNS